MQKGNIIQIKMVGMSFPKKVWGFVEENGESKKVFVKDALPGQLCEVMITKKRGGRIEGRVLRVIEKAPQEIEPGCSRFGVCGGCSLLNLPYDQQLALKDQYVTSLMNNADIEGYQHEVIVPSPEVFGYRNKMEYSFGDDRPEGPLCLGLHQKGSFYNICETPDCRIADEDFIPIMAAVKSFFAERKTTYFHKRTHEGFLRHLVLRKGKATGEILVNLVTSSQGMLDEQAFVEMMTQISLRGKIIGILHTINDGVADVVKADSQKLLYGKSCFSDRILGLNFEISAFSFFQTNTFGAEKLYSIVRDNILEAVQSEKAPVIFDLYCGTGTIAQVMAPIAERVIGIELIPEAVEAAKRNAAKNGLDNCTFIAGDVLKVVDTLPEKPQVIVLDPPREGIHPKAIFKIIDFQPDVFVYVACKAESLARDLPFFVNAGYRVEKLRCVDMFPHTVNVETVCLMTKLSDAKNHVEV